MRISEALGTAMRARMPLAPGRTEQLSAQADGVQLECVVEAAERLGCALGSLTVRRQTPARLSPPALREFAEALCQRATYLLEPLKLLEHDAAAGVALARSSPPAADERGVEYYELLANADGSAALTRWRWDAGVPGRASAPMLLTPPQFARLADDFAAEATR